MSTPCAPIVLFTYKRLDTLKRTISALLLNELADVSELHIYSDSAKTTADEAAISAVREYIKTIEGFKSVNIIESTENKGLARSIIFGVSQVLERYDSVIVMEDDLITTANFLQFMNQALNNYRDKGNVFSISGYSFNLTESDIRIEHDAYFLNRGWSWGWATWKDRWNEVDWEVKDYPQFKNNLTERLKFAKGGSDLNGMLRKQIAGKIDSWAIRWFYSQFKNNGLTLYPTQSKVLNDGFDMLSTHTKGSIKRYLPLLDDGTKKDFKFPELSKIDLVFQKRFLKKMGIWARLMSKVDTLISSLRK